MLRTSFNLNLHFFLSSQGEGFFPFNPSSQAHAVTMAGIWNSLVLRTDVSQSPRKKER